MWGLDSVKNGEQTPTEKHSLVVTLALYSAKYQPEPDFNIRYLEYQASPPNPPRRTWERQRTLCSELCSEGTVPPLGKTFKSL